MDLLPLFLSLIFLILLLYIFKTAKKNESIAANLPPSPQKLPIIGNLHQLGILPHQNLCKLSKKYGPIMLLQLGRIPTLVISSAELAKQLLQIHDAIFCSRPNSPAVKRFFYKSSDVAFSPYSDHWHERRRIYVSHLLNSKRNKSFWEAKEIEVNHLLESISLASESQKLVNLDEKMYDLVDGVITTVAFGKSYRGKQQFEGEALKDVMDEAMEVISCFSAEDFFPFVGFFFETITGQKRRLKNCFVKLDAYFQKVLDEHQDQSPKKDGPEDFADLLIQISKDPSSVGLSNNHIKAMLMNTFLGGVNSPAILMVWAMSELIKNPRVMQKVKAEIRSCIGRKEKLCPGDLENLTYLKMVVKETFRLHPPAPLLLPRQSISQCRIGRDNGYEIRPETRVLINVWAIGRDPETWENPDEFFPERFEKNSEINDFRGRHFELLPFGAGRRSCPAINLASGIIEFTLGNLLCFFDWEVPFGMKAEDIGLEEISGVTTHKATPLYLVPTRHVNLG